MKRIIAVLLVLALSLSIAPSAFAATDESIAAADRLYKLGLFEGTGTDADGNPIYDLDRAPTRHEAVTMLVRLLGKEEEALSGKWTIPFTDVADWAKPYVGYAYTHKLTDGIDAAKFGGNNPVTATQYLTFVLRALGYDSTADFRWDSAWELSDSIGLTEGEYTADNNAAFLRGDVTTISAAALALNMKNSELSLYKSICSPAVPKVMIYTDTDIPRSPYVDCDVRIIGDGQNIADNGATIKIRGNTTAEGKKKPYNIKLSFKSDVLGMGKAKKWCLLANCFEKTLLRNALAFDLARETGVPFTPDYRYVDVYLNDVLLGNYMLTEAVEVGPSRVDIDTDNNEYLLELDWKPEDEDCYYFYSYGGELKFAINEPEIDDLTEEQKEYVTSLIAKPEAALDSGDYAQVQEYFDVDSLSSFYLFLEFFRNVDVAHSSTRFHIKDGKIYGGPAWDYDLSAGNYSYNYYPYMYSEDNTTYKGLYAVEMKWLGLLTGYEEFQTLVEEKFLENFEIFENLYADNSLGTNRIDALLEAYGESIQRNFSEAGWGIGWRYSTLERYPDATYEGNIETLRSWLRNRAHWLLETWELTLPE